MPPAQPTKDLPVAVFDSGVGGLTVLHELLVALPGEDYVYLGDTLRFPYGDREPGELRAFSGEIASKLIERGAKLLVIACNSATAAAIDDLRERCSAAGIGVDVIGVIEPESVLAAATTRNGRIGLLATSATVSSGAYERALHRADPHTQLVSVACPELAPMIQDGATFDERTVALVREYCEPLRSAGVDTVILGCTHYPLVRPILQRSLGPGVEIITSGDAVARRVEHALSVTGLLSESEGEGSYDFLCTGDVESFTALGERFLQLPLGAVERIELESEVHL
ncbi:MAG: glutamate racemase [Actinomycetes bacterium]